MNAETFNAGVAERKTGRALAADSGQALARLHEGAKDVQIGFEIRGAGALAQDDIIWNGNSVHTHKGDAGQFALEIGGIAGRCGNFIRRGFNAEKRGC
jgi:hypothetical protein